MKEHHYIGNPCVKCGETLRYKKSTKCVACTSASYKRWSKGKEDSLNAYRADWYLKNRDRARKTNKAYQEEHRDKINKSAREYRSRNPGKIKALNQKYALENKDKIKEYNSKRYRSSQLAQYGLTEETYFEILKTQGGTCALCDRPPGDKHLAVDHCHTTGVVRGILCGWCNRGLGLFKDNIKVLKRAITYLEASITEEKVD